MNKLPHDEMNRIVLSHSLLTPKTDNAEKSYSKVVSCILMPQIFKFKRNYERSLYADTQTRTQTQNIQNML